MSKKRMGGSHGGHDESGHGGDRPWVYFMIDAFFLITQFFVLTFKVKSDELILPQKLPPGGGAGRKTTDALVVPKEQINVHVMRDTPGSKPTYMVKSGGTGQQNSLDQFMDMLSNTAQTKSPDKLSVRISYERDIPFGDVMPVFNACSKFKIAECGLIPLRATDRN